MNSALSAYGSVAIWFCQNTNSEIFQEGKNYIWKKFDLFGRECSIISEGNIVSAVVDLGYEKEKTLISTPISSILRSHMYALVFKWNNKHLSIFLNDKNLKEVKI